MANKAFDKIEYNNSTYLPQIPFVTGPSTDTTAGTWTGTIDGIDTLADGLIILYKPAVAGASTTTLNLNSLGAKTIYINNTSKLTTHFPKNQPILLVYSTSQNSGCWMCVDDYWTDSNTVPQASCATAADTAAKTASMTYYVATAKSYVMVNVRYANSAASAITLNINSTGAKPIYINGTASSTSNYTLPAGSYLVYYDGTNYYFRTDGKITGTTTGNLTDAGVTKITTTAGAHTAITNSTGAVSFSVPTTAAHVGAAESSHAHGNITSGGDITATAPTIASGDQIIINDHSASKITNGPTFDGSTTTKALTPKGTWETFLQSHQDISGKLDKTGGQLTGNLELYVASGDSPAVIFQRGTTSDNYNDWRIMDSGGYLYFDQRGSGDSGNWHTSSNRIYLDNDGGVHATKFYGDGSSLTGIQAGSSVTTATVTLSTSGWSSNMQTVTVNGVTTSNTVIVSPAPASYTLHGAYGIYCSGQSTNSLTFACATTPTSNITVNVIIL